MPREILDRRKRGFGTPMGAWLKRDLAPMLKAVLSPAGVPVWSPYIRGERTPWQDPTRRAALGAAARQRAVAHFSLDRMVRDYAEALEAL